MNAQQKLIENLKKQLEFKKIKYNVQIYTFAIKSVANTLNLNTEFPLAMYFYKSSISM